MTQNKTIPVASLAELTAVAFWSAMDPNDWFTWGLETFPAFIAVVLLMATYNRFPLTNLLYPLIALHGAILFIGAHYTYAQVPVGNWARDAFHLSRNHYDRIGNFFQGFVPALVGRELLLRQTLLKPGKWLAAIIILGCLGISACYELLEWRVAVNNGEAADAFLGTQGDPWDTQGDMATALVGACVALLLLSRTHDRLLAANQFVKE